MLRDAGYLAPRRSADRRCFADGASALLRLGGQIVDATVVEARRPWLKGDEKAVVKGGGVPAGWSKAKAAQIDRDGRWTLKRGRKRRPKADERVATALVVPCFGYKNHVTIDRRHGFVRRYTVTHAAAHDGGQLAAVQKRRLGLVVRTVGKARAEAKLGLANLVTNMLRLAWFETRPAPA